jgi:hypothetical protein
MLSVSFVLKDDEPHIVQNSTLSICLLKQTMQVHFLLVDAAGSPNKGSVGDGEGEACSWFLDIANAR